jgi:hypothetical protein
MEKWGEPCGCMTGLRIGSLTLTACNACSDIDPLVEDTEATPAEMEEGVDGSVQGLVHFYMNDSNFRQLVHEIHSHIDEVLADDEVRYEARV